MIGSNFYSHEKLIHNLLCMCLNTVDPTGIERWKRPTEYRYRNLTKSTELSLLEFFF